MYLKSVQCIFNTKINNTRKLKIKTFYLVKNNKFNFVQIRSNLTSFSEVY